jgi:photosystem II stability/assembly factor-like uncharacterized protein
MDAQPYATKTSTQARQARVRFRTILGAAVLVLSGGMPEAAGQALEQWMPAFQEDDAVMALAGWDEHLYAGTTYFGLQASADGGRNWRRLAACPDVESNPSVPAVHASQGLLVAAYEGTTVCRSFDGGDTWENDFEGLPDQPYLRDFVRVGDQVFAGVMRKAESASLFRSSATGGPWRPADTGIDSGVEATVGLALDAGGRLYAAVHRKRNPSPWIYQSEDTGKTWQPAPGSLAGPVYDLAWAGGFLLAATEHGVFRLQDGESNWEDCGPDFTSEPAYALAVKPGTVLVGAGSHVYLSRDAGGSWVALPGGLPGSETTVLTLWAGPGAWLAAIGPAHGVYRMEPPVTLLRPGVAPTRTGYLPGEAAWNAAGRRMPASRRSPAPLILLHLP